MAILICSSLRRVAAVDGLMSFLIDLRSGSRNHLVGIDRHGTGAAGAREIGAEAAEDGRELDDVGPAKGPRGRAHLRALVKRGGDLAVNISDVGCIGWIRTGRGLAARRTGQIDWLGTAPRALLALGGEGRERRRSRVRKGSM